MSELKPKCYDCLSEDIAMKVIRDNCPDWMAIWFCANCWQSLEAERAAFTKMLSEACAALDMAP